MKRNELEFRRVEERLLGVRADKSPATLSQIDDLNRKLELAMDDLEDAEDDGDENTIEKADQALSDAYDDERDAENKVEQIESQLAKLEKRSPRDIDDIRWDY